MLRLTASIMQTVHEPSFKEGLKKVADMGYEGFEFLKDSPMPNANWLPYLETPKAAKDVLREAGLRLAGIYVGADLIAEEKFAAEVEQAVSTARFVSSFEDDERNLIVGPPLGRPDPRPAFGRPARYGLLDVEYERMAEGLNQIGKACVEMGVTCLFHPHINSPIERRHEINHLLRLTNPAWVQICFDTGHMYAGGYDPADGVKEWGHLIRYLHLKDFKDGTYVDLGTGEIDNGRLFQAIREQGISGWVLPEVPNNTDPLGAARRNYEFIKKHLIEGEAI